MLWIQWTKPKAWISCCARRAISRNEKSRWRWPRLRKRREDFNFHGDEMRCRRPIPHHPKLSEHIDGAHFHVMTMVFFTISDRIRLVDNSFKIACIGHQHTMSSLCWEELSPCRVLPKMNPYVFWTFWMSQLSSCQKRYLNHCRIADDEVDMRSFNRIIIPSNTPESAHWVGRITILRVRVLRVTRAIVPE